MHITPEFFAARQSDFTGYSRTSTYIILEELLNRGYKVEMPYWPGRIIRFTAPDGTTRTINGVMNWNTPALARPFSNHKFITFELAKEVGLPVPDTEVYKTAKQATDFWDKYHGDCVIKTIKGTSGKGVWVHFSSREQFVDRAVQESARTTVLLQRKSHATTDLRLLFIGGELAAATVRRPFILTGNGTDTFSQLLRAENARREVVNKTHHHTMQLKLFDVTQVAAQLGRKVEDVLESGEQLQVSLANIAAGGTAEDVTDSLHPDFVVAAKKLDQALACPVLAVDFLCYDPSKSFEENNKDVIFLETGTRPGIDLHQYPHAGMRRNVAAQYIDYVVARCSR